MMNFAIMLACLSWVATGTLANSLVMMPVGEGRLPFQYLWDGSSLVLLLASLLQAEVVVSSTSFVMFG